MSPLAGLRFSSEYTVMSSDDFGKSTCPRFLANSLTPISHLFIVLVLFSSSLFFRLRFPSNFFVNIYPHFSSPSLCAPLSHPQRQKKPAPPCPRRSPAASQRVRRPRIACIVVYRVHAALSAPSRCRVPHAARLPPGSAYTQTWLILNSTAHWRARKYNLRRRPHTQ
jgi:hypothetical protein